MQKKYSIDISILIVNYKVTKKLVECIESIKKSKPKTSYEIIVVDNDPVKDNKKQLIKVFPKIKYYENENNGFGHANNIAARYAQGKYLFILNPDTSLINGAIDILYSYLEEHKKVTVAAPMLFDKNNNPYPLQGSQTLTPSKAFIIFSWIQKIVPNNHVFNAYWLLGENKKQPYITETVPGTAFMITKNTFEEIGGFDENFFLYFEEFDLCKRLVNNGDTLMIIPEAKIFHEWGASTKKRNDIKKIFAASRFYYFRKHFGMLRALLIESFLRFDKYAALLLIIILGGIFLRLFRLEQTMFFIGDQGWYYLSARDLILNHLIPLVGIASSHPWIHQGALWTYFLAIFLWIFHFTPFSGAYLALCFDVLSIILIFVLGSRMFTKKVGIIASVFYAVSEYMVIIARTPYHTTPIPFVTILTLYFLYSWLQGSARSFVLLILALGFLYNLEIATALFSIIVVFIFVYGFIYKKLYIRVLKNKKIISLSLFAYILSMLPMLLYDLSHRFVQTFGFVVWIAYKIAVLFGYPALHDSAKVGFIDVGKYFIDSYSQLIFPVNTNISIALFVLSSLFLTVKAFTNKNAQILFIINAVSILGLFVAKTPSGAYIPLLVPGLLLMLAYFIDYLLNKSKIVVVLLFIVILWNAKYVIDHNYSFVPGQITFTQMITASKQIVLEAKGREYNLKGLGSNSQFISYTMNYEYLTWWLGHGPVKQRVPLVITIEEKGAQIKVTKQSN